MQGSGDDASTAELAAKAVALHQRGALAEAERIYRAILTREDSAAVGTLLGAVLAQTGRSEEAIGTLKRALARDPRQPFAWSALGNLLFETGPAAAAIEPYQRALALKPGDAVLAYNLANALRVAGRLDEALASYDAAITTRPAFFEAVFNKAITLQQMARPAEAEAVYAKAMALQPTSAECHNNRGNVLGELQRHGEALEEYETAIALKPDYAVAWNNKGNAFRTLGRHEEALASYAKATDIDPRYGEAHNNHGLALLERRQHVQALACFERALALDPDSASAYAHRGEALHALGQNEAALESLDRALALQPDRAETHSTRALVQLALNRKTEALASCEKAIRLKPDYSAAYNNRGLALHMLRRYGEAVESYDQAIAIDSRKRSGRAPHSIRPGRENGAVAYYNRGITQNETKRLREALASMEKAVALNPEQPYALGELAFINMSLCEWGAVPQLTAQLVDGIARGAPLSAPFPLLSLSCPPEIRRRCAEIYVAREYPQRAQATQSQDSSRDRIRIAYVSGNFNPHPVAQLLAGVIEAHDRSRFEIIGVSLTAPDGSAIHERLSKAFDRFVPAHDLSDGAIAKLLRELGVDIAVDLMGFTQHARTGIFACRAAPIQVNYLGFAGTMGAPYVDYIVADATVIPVGDEKFYVEKIVRLPDTYLPTDGGTPQPDPVPTRAEAGLPDSGFVFCSFNNSYKLSPDTFALWMRLLRAVDGSVLWLTGRVPSAAKTLASFAAEHGVDPARLIFAPLMPRWSEHMARLKLADLFLDTQPYNAHTTAVDALWAGVPVLTCLGDSFAGRVAGSLVRAIGMPELVAPSPAAYEARAVSLAKDAGELQRLKQKLATNRASHPLFDTERYTRHLEAAFIQMRRRGEAGEPPAPFNVRADA